MGALTVVDAESGAVPLARLLAMSYQLLIEDLHVRLAAGGWTDVRPAFGFVLLALRNGSVSMRDLTVVLGTTKQAVSKLVDSLVAAGYADRCADPGDGRAKQVQLTGRGRDLLAAVEQIYAELETGWESIIGADHLDMLRSDLETVVRAANGGELPSVRPVG